MAEGSRKFFPIPLRKKSDLLDVHFGASGLDLFLDLEALVDHHGLAASRAGVVRLGLFGGGVEHLAVRLLKGALHRFLVSHFLRENFALGDGG